MIEKFVNELISSLSNRYTGITEFRLSSHLKSLRRTSHDSSVNCLMKIGTISSIESSCPIIGHIASKFSANVLLT